MLYELNISTTESKNYCNNYIKKLIDKYFYLFSNSKYNNLFIKHKLDENKYLIDYYINDNNNIDIYEVIKELLIKIEKHIKNIYPDCGSTWNLNFNYTKVLSN